MTQPLIIGNQIDQTTLDVNSILPSQTGNNGFVLTTDGSAAAWAALPGSVNVFTYTSNTTTTGAGIASGDIRWNNSTQISATSLFVSNITSAGYDISALFAVMVAGDRFYFQQTNSPSHFQTWQVVSVTNNTTYYTFVVTLLDSLGGNYSNNTKLSVGLVRAAAGGTGTVTSVSVTTANGVSGSVATATTTPAISLTLGAITPSSVAASGTVTGSNLSGTNTGNQTITLTGDATNASTSTGGALTLATVNSNVGTFAVSTVNAKGLVTAASALTGDITTSGAASTLATVNSNVGSFTLANITVDAKGRITAAANGSGGSPALTSTYIGYGSGGNVLTGDANFTNSAGIIAHGVSAATAATIASNVGYVQPSMIISGASSASGALGIVVKNTTSSGFSGNAFQNNVNTLGALNVNGSVTGFTTIGLRPNEFGIGQTNAGGTLGDTTLLNASTSTFLRFGVNGAAATTEYLRMTGTATSSLSGLIIPQFTAAGVLTNDTSGQIGTVAPGASGNVLTSNGTTWASTAAAAVTATADGYLKASVRVATTVNGTLATAFANGQTVDSIVLATGDRILIKNQTTTTDNGIYTVNVSGAPTRATDADGTNELFLGTQVYVRIGTIFGGNTFQLVVSNANPIVPGTSTQIWMPLDMITVQGRTALAVTSQPVASGGGAIAIGERSLASGNSSIAIGNATTTASAANTIAIGLSASAVTSGSIAIGAGAAGTGNAMTIVGGSATIASGANNTVIGNTASVTVAGASNVVVGFAASALTNSGTVVLGVSQNADFFGEIILGSWGFASATDAKIGMVKAWTTTTTTGAVELGIGATGITTIPTNRIALTNNSTYIFDCQIVARKSTAGTDYAAFQLTFLINREANAASTALVGSPVATVIAATAGAATWTCGVTADTTNGRPNISVTGQAATTIRWVANIRMTKVSG